ncbi:hypothetical protein LSTR_LSTR008993 [Laodelphax striatellus]|uniref:BED-type domain-containing protein n=1 Tax=Laodelphax striatellus TaxID=195883 RepID=A0A482WYZ9_LAOST|nr:hypothetical protein LSTR_LSTR008993 [Laodelphax striatellus]
MFYENRRLFCKNSKRQVVKKYVMKELRKSLQCRFCPAHFSEWKSFRKHIRLSHEDHDCKKEIRFSKTLFSNRICKVSLPTKSSSVKCKLCGEYLPHSDRETCKKHMNEKHNLAFITGATYENYKDCEISHHGNIVSMNDEIVLKDDSHVNTFFVRSGSSYAKCKLCKKFISKSIYCRHRIPSIYSLSFGVKSVEKFENLSTVGKKSVPKKMSSPIYSSSLNIVKNYCDICLKNPMSSICRCIVNRRFVPTVIRQNESVLSTEYLQDISKSERQVYSVLFSLNYFEKSCCLLCSEKISQSSKLLACFDHFRLNHGTLVKNWKRMCKTVERRRLMDNIEYTTYFDDSLFGLLNAGKNRTVESNAISEQPAMILNSADENQGASESENPVLCYEIDNANPNSSFNFASENATSSFSISSANPTASLDFNNENPSSNFIVISEINTLDSIGNPTSSQDVDTETHSSVLAITSSENQGVNVAGEAEVAPTYEERFGERRRTSVLWSFFTRIGPKAAACNACSRVSQISSLANLSRHLKNKHPKLAELLKQKRIKQILSESGQSQSGVPVFNKWMYFNKLNNEWAECNKCKRYISMRGGSTGNLLRHLRSKNCINKEVVCHSTNEPKAKESRRSASNVWQYFEKESSDKAVCSTCKHTISIKNNNTSNLARHLRTVHSMYIFPSSTFNLEVSDLKIVAHDSTPLVQYKYVVDEQLNISQVTNNDSFANNEACNSGENLLEETFPSYIAEEVVDVNPVPVQNDDEAPETISLDTLLNKIYRSPSWKYFTKLANARVRCNLCKKTLAFKSSKCINNLTRHLKKKHASEIASTHPEPEPDGEKFVVFVDANSETEVPTKKVNKRPRTSYLWNYFTRSDHLKIVTCNICQIDLSYKSCPISNLRRHLEVKHSNVLKDIKMKPLSSE